MDAFGGSVRVAGLLEGLIGLVHGDPTVGKVQEMRSPRGIQVDADGGTGGREGGC